MHTGIVVMLAVAAACALAPPSEESDVPAIPRTQNSPQELPRLIPEKEYFRKYIVPKFILPYFLGYEESPRMSPSSPELPKRDWLTKEIERINQMAVNDAPRHYEPSFPKNVEQNPYFQRVYPKKENDFNEQEQEYKSDRYENFIQTIHKMPTKTEMGDVEKKIRNHNINGDRVKFASTPLDKEFYEYNPILQNNYKSNTFTGPQEGEYVSMADIEPPRKIRQNPNLNKEKTLVVGNLGKIQSGMTNKDYRLIVSLLPTNLRWLNLDRQDKNEKSVKEERKATSRADNVNVSETPNLTDPADSIYSVAVIAAVGAALAMAIFGFAIGWYTLSKKAKAAAEVDYPAYGVTGPSIDTSGDRKLAHSAHMYHYQHQKQQIIAMERDSLEHRNGSVSDPESEVENEEGDYTVYECPGFATTGNMEVKNPLFTEEPSPLTPGKCQVVKQQPKD